MPERDEERVSLEGLHPEDALRALLQVDPTAPPDATKDDDESDERASEQP